MRFVRCRNIIREFPNTVYVVVGQTHPNVLRQEGEAYRLSLERLAKDLHMGKHVVFFDRFVELEELTRFLGAADIYLTPYLTEEQITSGTLAYAFGAGNAVVSTPYWHAAELLAAGRGKLVPFRDAKAITAAVVELLRDEPLRDSMRKNAYRTGRDMVWTRVAQLYMKSFEQARQDYNFIGHISSPIKTLDKQPGQLPEMKLDHLFRMSDSTGIFQHASFTVPNFAEGYCTDDNARALVLALMLRRLGHGSQRLGDQAAIYAAFLNHAFDRKRRRFRNFMSFDRRWLEEVGSEDCHGHALWALGLCVSQAGQDSFQMLAAELFEQALPLAAEFTSPRAWAYTLIGIDEYLRRLSGDRRAEQIRASLSAKLTQRYADTATDEWQWFEDVVSYANAKLAHAMILSGRCMNDGTMLELGLTALRWLTNIQTSDAGSFPGPSAQTDSSRVARNVRSLISNPLKHKQRFLPASRRIAQRATRVLGCRSMARVRMVSRSKRLGTGTLRFDHRWLSGRIACGPSEPKPGCRVHACLLACTRGDGSAPEHYR